MEKISWENKWGVSPIKESYFRIMGILVDLRELCERSVEYNVAGQRILIYKYTNIQIQIYKYNVVGQQI